MSRAGDDGVEDAFPAKKHIFYTGNGLDIHGTGGFHSSQITGIYDDLLTGLQVVFDNMAVKFQEYHPFSGKALQYGFYAFYPVHILILSVLAQYVF